MVANLPMCRYYKGMELPTKLLSVVVGAHVIHDKSYERSQRRHSIQEVVVHEKYLSEIPRNDIMLLRLSSNIEYNNDVQPICVDASVFPAKTRCYVTGWGNTVTTGMYTRCSKNIPFDL